MEKIIIYLSKEDKAVIVDRAKQKQVSTSAYLRMIVVEKLNAV